jgi:hypothetical protein
MRRSLVTPILTACVFAACPAAAQTLRLSSPFPPLPLTPLPPPSIDTSPVATDSERPARPLSAPEPAAVDAVALALAEIDTDALRRSRLHEAWYGWQTLVGDAAAVVTLLIGNALVVALPPRSAAIDPRPAIFGTASFGIYMGSPLAIHMSHGSVWQAIASLGLRIALPIAGFALGSLVGLHDPRQSVDATFGGFAGCALAAAVDASSLAWDRWQRPVSSPGTARAAVVGTRGSF